MVAIKVVRSIKKYREAAMIEMICSSCLESMTELEVGECSFAYNIISPSASSVLR